MNGDTAHREKPFENYILQQLKDQGWEVGDTKGYDTEYAMYPADLVGWLKATQPEKWVKIQKDHSEPEVTLMGRLAKVLDDEGTVQVLRRGFQLAGAGHIDLSEAAPEDKRNKEILKRYKANILRVVPQLKYHPTRALALDFGFFINGLPVATVEVKTEFTQSAEAAVEQYKTDRLPIEPNTRRREPLLTYKRGAVVHFAMSESDIQMATKLDGENTVFLPFNRGNDGHKGNPPVKNGKYPVCYFWEDVCQPDAWLRIFHSFAYVAKKDVTDLKGKWTRNETLIFPRFHQWDAVNKMIADAKKYGPGMPYLCEHSAGSGKTSTISWTAHDLIKLRNNDGEAIFSSVIIVTDRTVLDSQLQDAVKQIDVQAGVIAAIDKDRSGKSKSKLLAEALLSGIPIIVVTIQTFPYALGAIVSEQKLKGKNFAVIVDEAHTSQTGSSAGKLQAALTLEVKDGDDEMNVEQLLEALQKSRVRPKNISYFAFTATPKHSTYMLFGRTRDGKKASDENLPEPFHQYRMRQAIEEGFILDVLEGYTSYQTAFNLSKQGEDVRRVGSKAAKKTLAKWMALHPTNVRQKVEFIIEHFSANVAYLLAGKAKAMVVTSSRAAVIRYKHAFDDFINAHPEHAHIRSLVAFSGKLKGKDVTHPTDPDLANEVFLIDEEAEFTELTMNPDAHGKDLRIAFEGDGYRIMLVADKFQTGFDQPKLVAMYVDKKIGNDVEIVQTLSRLNRTAPGKDEIFVIDFVNDPDNVQRAFRKYDDGAKILKVQDLNVIYDLKRDLDAFGLYQEKDLEAFKVARYRDLGGALKAQEQKHQELYAATNPAKVLYNDGLKNLVAEVRKWESAYEASHKKKDKAGMEAAEHQRKIAAAALDAHRRFKDGLGRFGKLYSYISQILDLGDPDLESFAAFAKLLRKELEGVPPENVDMNGVILTGFEIRSRAIRTSSEEPEVLKPIGRGGEVKAPEIAVYLKEILERSNHIFGEVACLQDQIALINSSVNQVMSDSTVMAQLENNTPEQAIKGNFSSVVEEGLATGLDAHDKLVTALYQSQQQLAKYKELIFELVLKKRTINISDVFGP